ncbi:MAG TPA: endo-1,4-beta-xylanase [Limnochordia bacterium]|nr:endo-1,4-beta-xylanase [Limnochordia bacterium]HXK97956.1 endo-1,4-beta-xylanase [Limnochordia bacterium]
MLGKRITAAVLVVAFVLAGSAVGWAEDYVLPSLREIYKDYFHIGGAVSVASWAPKTLVSHRDIILGQLSSVTAENAMKPDYLQPREGAFNFREPDNLVAFAKEHGMVVRGHTLVWHAQTADWFFRDKDGRLIYEKETVTEEDRQLVISRLEAHIEAVMTHYGDDVYCWDVVNEAVSDDAAYILRPESPWMRTIGEEFIRIAFRKAHEVNPNIKLFYNDYNAVAPYKRGRIHKLLADLLAEGVPVHGIGIQGHWGIDSPTLTEIEESIKMYAELGLEIHITELDIGIGNYTEEEQAERYRQVFELFKKYSDVITNVTLWGLADDASWRGDDNPLLFGRDHEPKPAFWAIVDTSRPWYVNKAEHTGAVIFKDAEGRLLGTLKPGEYQAADLDFPMSQAAKIEMATSYIMTLASGGTAADRWHFIDSGDFDGAHWAEKAEVISITTLPQENIAAGKPVDANHLAERAYRAVDGSVDTSWAPRETPPYWLMVDLEQPYLLYRWVCKLHGTGPLARIPESPFNAADFKLQVSDDGVNWTDVDAVEGNTASTTSRDLDLIQARYVRLYVTRPSNVEINQNLVVYELELYGLPVE